MSFCTTKNIVSTLFLLLLVSSPIVVYVYHFFHSTFSYNTSDWGAFGSYYGGTISIVSVYLLYVTYKEQRRSNSISQFEQRFYTQLKTTREMLDGHDESLKKSYHNVKKHFPDIIYSQPLTREDVIMACGYYFKDLQREGLIKSKEEQVFTYVIHSITMTDEHNVFSKRQKRDYIQDIFPLLNNDFLVLLLFYIISKRDVLTFYLLQEYHYSSYLTTNGPLMDKVIGIILSSSDMNSSHILDGIEYENYENESIYETINRLKKNNTSKAR